MGVKELARQLRELKRKVETWCDEAEELKDSLADFEAKLKEEVAKGGAGGEGEGGGKGKKKEGDGGLFDD